MSRLGIFWPVRYSDSPLSISQFEAAVHIVATSLNVSKFSTCTSEQVSKKSSCLEAQFIRHVRAPNIMIFSESDLEVLNGRPDFCIVPFVYYELRNKKQVSNMTQVRPDVYFCNSLRHCKFGLNPLMTNNK